MRTATRSSSHLRVMAVAGLALLLAAAGLSAGLGSGATGLGGSSPTATLTAAPKPRDIGLTPSPRPSKRHIFQVAAGYVRTDPQPDQRSVVARVDDDTVGLTGWVTYGSWVFRAGSKGSANDHPFVRVRIETSDPYLTVFCLILRDGKVVKANKSGAVGSASCYY
jgi:hypothetical protein